MVHATERQVGGLTRGLGAVVLAAAIAVVPAGSAGAAEDGVLSLSESAGPAGSSFEVTAYCLSTTPTLLRHDTFTDTVAEVLLSTADDVEWTATITSDRTDVQLTFECGERTTQATYDVEHPLLIALPVMGRSVTAIAGTDCASQGPAAVTFTAADGTVQAAEASVDPETGGWEVDVPAALVGQAFEVDATCGEAVYATLAVAEVPGSTTTTTSTTVVPPVVPPAPPAPSISGRPTFTG